MEISAQKRAAQRTVSFFINADILAIISYIYQIIFCYHVSSNMPV